MKKFLSMLAVVFTVGLSTVAMEAEAAKRMGSGKSMGTQRQMTQDKAPAAPAQSAAAAPAAGAAAATPSRSWMGPVAGLAAGLGLAALSIAAVGRASGSSSRPVSGRRSRSLAATPRSMSPIAATRCGGATTRCAG